MEEYKVAFTLGNKGRAISPLSFNNSKYDGKKLKKYLNQGSKTLFSAGLILIEFKNEKIIIDLIMDNRNRSYAKGIRIKGKLLNNLKNIGVKRNDTIKAIYSHFYLAYISWTIMEEKEIFY